MTRFLCLSLTTVLFCTLSNGASVDRGAKAESAGDVKPGSVDQRPMLSRQPPSVGAAPPDDPMKSATEKPSMQDIGNRQGSEAHSADVPIPKPIETVPSEIPVTHPGQRGREILEPSPSSHSPVLQDPDSTQPHSGRREILHPRKSDAESPSAKPQLPLPDNDPEGEVRPMPQKRGGKKSRSTRLRRRHGQSHRSSLVDKAIKRPATEDQTAQISPRRAVNPMPTPGAGPKAGPAPPAEVASHANDPGTMLKPQSDINGESRRLSAAGTSKPDAVVRTHGSVSNVNGEPTPPAAASSHGPASPPDAHSSDTVSNVNPVSRSSHGSAAKRPETEAKSPVVASHVNDGPRDSSTTRSPIISSLGQNPPGAGVPVNPIAREAIVSDVDAQTKKPAA